MNHLITVVVPIFRVEKYLSRCVNSIISQSYKNLEIILVDDGSDDACPMLCDEYALKDDRIKVIHQKNGGLSNARNSGIKIAKGEYIAFIDSDDAVSLNFIQKLYDAIIKTGADIAQCNYLNFTKELPTVQEDSVEAQVYSPKEMLIKLCQNRCAISTVVAWSKLYKTSLFNDVLYAEGKLHEDEFTTYKLFDKASKIAVIDQPLYYYFENSEGITHKKIDSRRLDAMEAFLERYDYYVKKGYNELLPSLTCKIFESFLVLSRLIKNDIKDYNKFNTRINLLYKQAKSRLNVNALSKQNKIVFKLSNSYKAFKFNLKFIEFLRKTLKALGIISLYKKIRNRKVNKAYKNEIKTLFKGYKPEKTAFILGSIEYDNLGDHAILYAQKKFLLDNLQDYRVIEVRAHLFDKTKKLLSKKISPKSLITIAGGGNMGDIWIDDENRRREIIKLFPLNRIIVFPQTVFYSETVEGIKELNKSKSIYFEHDNLTLSARESTSFNLIKEYYPKAKIVLTPDTVLSLTKFKGEKKRNGVGICIREDKEKSVSACSIQKLKESLTDNNIAFEDFSTISKTNVSLKEREKKLDEIFNQISSYELVITDRLHAMIFSYLTNTPCLVLDNDNHKVYNIYNEWLKDCNYIKATNEENLLNDAINAYKKEYEISDIKFDFSELKGAL